MSDFLITILAIEVPDGEPKLYKNKINFNTTCIPSTTSRKTTFEKREKIVN